MNTPDREFDTLINLDEHERIKDLEAQLREAEQFARDVAHKLDMPYAPPVAKGDCAYLAALEALKERAEAAEARAGRLRAALEMVEWDAEWGDCLWCNRNRNQGHAPTCKRQAALHGEQEGAAKEGVRN